MNDRFRFRLWDAELQIYFFSNDDGSLQFDIEKVLDGLSLHEEEVLEQCTGLKDASGRLIYEGDLLLLDPDDPLALVVWNEDIAMFSLVQEDVCYTFDNCGYSPQEMEVIGNIHENPELREDK